MTGEITVIRCAGSRRLRTVMSRVLLFAVLFLSAQWHYSWQQTLYQTKQQHTLYQTQQQQQQREQQRQQQPQQRASYDDVLLDTSTTDRWHRRSKRDIGSVKVNTPDYYTTFPSNYDTSTGDIKTTNKQVTTDLTTNLKNTEELSTWRDWTRLSNLLIDVSVKVTASSIRTTLDSGYTTVDTATDAAVKWLNVSDTGYGTGKDSHEPTAGCRENPDTSEASFTHERDKQIITTATTNKTHLTAHSDYMSYTIASAIRKYVQPVTAVVGVGGNTISMLVMFQRDNRQTSFCMYLGILAVSDTLALCTATSYWLVRLLSSSPIQDIDCQIHGWLMNALQMNGFFLIISLTYDRLIAVRFPLKAVAWCSARRAKFVSGVIFVVAWLANVPFFVYNHVKSGNICAMGTTGSVMSIVYPWISVFVGLVVPFVSLISMNVVIMMAIRRRRRNRGNYAPERRRDTTNLMEMSETQSSSQDAQQNQPSGNRQLGPMTSRDRNAIVTLFLVSFTFLLFVTPHFVHIATFSMTKLTSERSQHADYTLFFQVSRKLYYANNACNVFLYCLSGTKFRSDVVRLFRHKASSG